MLGEIPLELVLEILCLASASSQTTYRTILLVSRQFNSLARLHCLTVVPITLEGYEQLSSFGGLLHRSPGIQAYVRHLWIMGDGSTCWHIIDSILKACTRITSLACTTRSLASLCSDADFQHTQCTELTLVEIWHSWSGVVQAAHGLRLCNQLTHLRMHEGLSPAFPRHYFAALTHLAFSSRADRECLEGHLEMLACLPRLQLVVATTFWWRDNAPDASTAGLLDLDGRLAVVHCRRNWTELGVWGEGVRGGFSLWDQAKLERRSMQIFRGAFRRLKR